MLNIDTFTLGNSFKDDQGNEWRVTSNFSQNENKILIEVSKETLEPIKE